MAATATHGTLTLIARLSKVSIRRSSEEMLGMSLRNYLAVSYVVEPGGISQQQLGEILGIDPNNMVLLLNDLEEAGLTRRVRDPADRRRHIVEITEHGRAAYGRAQRARESIEDEVLAALSSDERATLHALLAKALRE